MIFLVPHYTHLRVLRSNAVIALMHTIPHTAEGSERASINLRLHLVMFLTFRREVSRYILPRNDLVIEFGSSVQRKKGHRFQFYFLIPICPSLPNGPFTNVKARDWAFLSFPFNLSIPYFNLGDHGNSQPALGQP